MPGGPELRFHGVRASEAQDSIQQFSASRQVQSNAVSISSWDPYQLLAPAAETVSALDIGDTPPLQVYDGALERRFADNSVAGLHAELRLKALELGNKSFEGHSSVRQLNPGHRFKLSRHERYAQDNPFTVLSVSHRATNNLDGGMARLSLANPLERGTYRNQFTCVRQAVAIVPLLAAQRPAPTALGPQSALVVGLEDASLTTERDHRIKIQFPWQRGQAPNPGGLFDTQSTANPEGNAPGNDRSGTWVRVAEAVAGPNWGSVFTPRIGSEVLVDFIENDIDRPVIVASLYNGSDLPPFAAGVDSGRNHAGVISGIHSHNLDAGGYNQWVVDDSTNQLRMRLASSTAASQLNLGHLISQSVQSAQRGHYRGQGFELRTDAWGVIRGEHGVFISTQARNRQGSGIPSSLMDSSESQAQLKAAQSLTETMTQAAAHHNALASSATAQAQQQRMAAIDPQQNGKYPSDVNGQPALKAQNAGRDLDNSQPVEQFQNPFIHLDSAAGMAWASPNSTTVFAGGQLHWTTQADSHWAAANSLAAVSANATTLFTHAGGIQAIAADGPVSLQAHTDTLEILADQAVTVTSVNGRIDINAKDKITLQAGQTAITLDGGNITFTCPGQFTVHAAQHPFEGGSSQAAQMERLPDTRVKLFDEAFVIRDPEGNAIPGLKYKISTSGGEIYRGVTNEKGEIDRIFTLTAEKLKIEPDMDHF